ncbi:hypothetical protein VFES401_13955 [Aliivibrio fischeri]|uniref:hypothetical protein n=1 Tax=Aliivibrio fischeri TaxID=668 RepID=UPI0007C4A38F|nr:hypothetical protein [Aliivibrio fischeri]TGA68009.1 hypothetical protein VFES401_13955 [Aliivibrio fischeri]
MAYTDPIHMPCPTMAGMENPSRELREKSLNTIKQLRNTLGLQRSQKQKPRPLTYTCTGRECLERWEL